MHPALQDLRSLRFHECDSNDVLAYSKTDGDDTILVVCTLDPNREHEATIWWDMPALGMDWSERFVAHDLISDSAWTWSHGTYVQLRPWDHVAHVVHHVGGPSGLLPAVRREPGNSVGACASVLGGGAFRPEEASNGGPGQAGVRLAVEAHRLATW